MVENVMSGDPPVDQFHFGSAGRAIRHSETAFMTRMPTSSPGFADPSSFAARSLIVGTLRKG